VRRSYLRDRFGLEEDPAWTPRYNISPMQLVPTIRKHHSEPRRTWGLMRWGLIPASFKNAEIGFKTINAIAETAGSATGSGVVTGAFFSDDPGSV